MAHSSSSNVCLDFKAKFSSPVQRQVRKDTWKTQQKTQNGYIYYRLICGFLKH